MSKYQRTSFFISKGFNSNSDYHAPATARKVLALLKCDSLVDQHLVLVVTSGFLVDTAAFEKLLCLLRSAVQQTVLLQSIAGGHGLLFHAGAGSVAHEAGHRPHRVRADLIERHPGGSPGLNNLVVLEVL